MDDHAACEPHQQMDVHQAIDAALQGVQRARQQLVHTMRRSDTFKTVARRSNELRAHWFWSGRTLQGGMRVPLPSEWDSRHVVALLEFARVVNEYLRSSSVSELPPATVAIMLAETVPFLMPNGVLLREVSLSPYCVIERKEYSRLITAALVHIDATHLITNMTAALPECLYLEDTSGSAALLADVVLLTLLTHGLFVGTALLQKHYFVKRETYYSVVGVGASGVVFALKVWAGYKRSGRTSVWGLIVPSQFSWVPTLAFTHLCAPEASFPCHLCGVLAGILRAYVIEPALHWRWPGALRPQLGGGGPAQSNNHDSSSTTTQDQVATSRDLQQANRRRRPSTAAMLRDLGLQLALAAAATAVYFVATRRQRGSTISAYIPTGWSRIK